VPLSDHSVGVVLLNKDTQGSLVTAEWSSVGLPPNTPCKGTALAVTCRMCMHLSYPYQFATCGLESISPACGRRDT